MKKISWFLLVVVGLCACNLPVSEDAVATAIKQTDSAEATKKVDEEPQSTETPINTPTESVKESFIEQIEIDSFRLFNSSEDPSNLADRDYGNTFSQANARIIYLEFDFSHPGPSEDVEFTINAVYFGPHGNVYGEVGIDPLVEAGWTSSNWILGYGFSEFDPDSWDEGDYRVFVYLDGQEIASDNFSIIKDTPTPKPTLTYTPMPGAVVDTDSLNIRKGPGTMYAIVTGVDRGDTLEINGQAYSCEWLKIETENGLEGWVSAELVVFETPCSSIPAAQIPPTPIPLPSSTPIPQQVPTSTQAPSGKTVTIKVNNKTGGNITLTLSGPASYTFTLGPGTHKLKVLPGKYNWTAWGCGGASDSGTYNTKKLEGLTFTCN